MHYQTANTPTVFHAERGAALLTVLLMIALASILLSSLLRDQQILTRQTSILQTQSQMMQYCRAAEFIAAQQLINDQKVSTIFDSYYEAWAKPQAFSHSEQNISMKINMTDATAKLNLNNVIGSDSTHQVVFIEVLSRLFTSLGLNTQLVGFLVDWVDADSETQFGSEDDYYGSLPEPYLPSNLPLQNINELMSIRGFTPQIIETLTPFVMVAPSGSLLNINTASGTVLAALDAHITAATGANLAETHLQIATENVNALWSATGFSSISETQRTLLVPLLAVTSNRFQIQTEIMQQQFPYRCNSFMTHDGQLLGRQVE